MMSFSYKTIMLRIFIVLTALFALIIGVYAVTVFGEGYQSCKIGRGKTWQDLEKEYKIPAAIIAEFNNKSVDIPLTEGMRIKIPDSYREVEEQPIVTAINDTTKETVTLQVGNNQISAYIAKITVENAEIRRQPNSTSTLLFDKNKRGDTVLVTGENATYYAIYMADGTIGWMSKATLELTGRAMAIDKPKEEPQVNNYLYQEIINTAYTYIGTPYKYGGKLPNSVDCSLLVQTVFKYHGFSLPRTAAEQSKVGIRVEKENLQMGDRIYFYDPGTSRIGHTGIYISDDRFIHASSNRKQVAVDLLSSGNYPKNYAWSMRFEN